MSLNDQMRRTLMLQVLHNGRVELETSPSPEVDHLLSSSPVWLRLLTPTHSWPPGMVRRIEMGSEARGIAFPPAGCPAEMRWWLAVARQEGWIQIIDGFTGGTVVREGSELKWQGNEGPVNSLVWGSYGLLVSGSDDSAITGWDPWQQEQPLYARVLQNSVRALAWSPDGRCLAMGTADRQLLVVDGCTDESIWQCGTNAGPMALRWREGGRDVWAADNGDGTGSPRVYRVRMEGKIFPGCQANEVMDDLLDDFDHGRNSTESRATEADGQRTQQSILIRVTSVLRRGGW